VSALLNALKARIANPAITFASEGNSTSPSSNERSLDDLAPPPAPRSSEASDGNTSARRLMLMGDHPRANKQIAVLASDIRPAKSRIASWSIGHFASTGHDPAPSNHHIASSKGEAV
jgi:hypothetical protein